MKSPDSGGPAVQNRKFGEPNWGALHYRALFLASMKKLSPLGSPSGLPPIGGEEPQWFLAYKRDSEVISNSYSL